MSEDEATQLRERLEEVWEASVEAEGAAPIDDPLERRLQEVAGYAGLYFNDLYHTFPGARALKRATIAVTRPILNEQVLYNQAVRDVVFELRRRLEEAEEGRRRAEERLERLERRLEAWERPS